MTRLVISSLFLVFDEWHAEFFVEGKEMLDAFALAVEGAFAIESVNGAVILAVGFAKVGRHGVRVIKVGQRYTGMVGARVKNGLPGFGQRGLGFVCKLWPWEGVVDHTD